MRSEIFKHDAFYAAYEICYKDYCALLEYAQVYMPQKLVIMMHVPNVIVSWYCH